MRGAPLALLFALFFVVTLVTTKQTTTCSEQEWRCRDGTCIEFTARCNGTAECLDGTDETYSTCLNNRCPENMFRCAYGACIDRTAVCNNQPNCNDLSDESFYKCHNSTIVEIDQFKCSDGQLIPSASLCDGIGDCKDGSDESIRACVDEPCPTFMYQCAYGACIDQGANCDGLNDCADGSDESDDLCIWKPLSKIEVDLPPGHCLLPSYPDNGGYTVVGEPNAGPRLAVESATLEVSCNFGYEVLGESNLNCSKGIWSSAMPNCCPMCRLEKNDSVEYNCVEKVDGKQITRTCEEYVPHGMQVLPECRPTYHYPDGIPNHMECNRGKWSHVVTCKQDTCKLPVYDNVKYYKCVQTVDGKEKKVSCQDVMPEGTEIRPVCQRNYYYFPLIPAARCIDEKWDGVVQCMPECGKPYNSQNTPPWHAAVYRKLSTPYELICGGSLVSRNVVISAAQCFWDDKLQPADNFAVAVGTTRADWDHPDDNLVYRRQRSNVTNIKVPSEFAGALNDFKGNIALVFLSTQIEYINVGPVCLDFNINTNAYQLHNNQGQVAAWELQKKEQKLTARELLYTKQRLCIASASPEIKRYITYDKICAGILYPDFCRVDVGVGYAFPALDVGQKRYYLRGVAVGSVASYSNASLASNSNGCDSKTAYLFTHVIEYKEFIENNVREE